MADEGRPALLLSGEEKVVTREPRNRLKMLAIAGFSGFAFLVPLLLIILVLDKVVDFAGKLAIPVAKLFPERIVGIGGQTLIGLTLLILLSFAAGLLAQTRWGKSSFDALGATLVGGLPQFVAARVTRKILNPQDGKMVVVLVPVGPRWSIGIAFGPLDGDWASIYLPNAPRFTSGSVSFVRSIDIHPLDMDVLTAVRLIRRLGEGAEQLLPGLMLPNAAPAAR